MLKKPYGLILVSLYLLLVYACNQTKKPGIEKPNIILIISDDQGWTDYGFMGHQQIETPNLDSFAKNSLCFTHGYCTAPLCSPSLATLITGLYAHQHGITGNDPAFSYEGQRYSEEWLKARQVYFDSLKQIFYQNTLLTEYLAEAGYRTLQTGKWWLGSWQEGHFDAGMTHGNPEKEGRHGDEGLKIGREGLEKIFDFVDESQKAEHPFFIWYAPFLPHTPHTPPDSLLQKYLKRTNSEYIAKYWAMCEWFDQTCGQIIDFISEKNLDEETLIIYTSDNGWIQKPDENGYDERSKRTPYEMGIRTPLMLRWPGKIQAQQIDTIPASNIDIVPTILAAAGINHDSMPGINLLDLKNERRVIYSEAYEHDITDLNDPSKSLQYQVAIEYPWKFILPNESVVGDTIEAELFNLQEDPHELQNLNSENPGKANRLKNKILLWK